MTRFALDRRLFLTASGVLITAGTASCSGGASGEAIARTTAGQVRGERAANGVMIFKGIPYGDDTSGANRFLPPKPATAWEGVKDCMAYANTAPQTVPRAAPSQQAAEAAAEPAPEAETAPATPRPTSPIRNDAPRPDEGEDCLALNVWTPDTKGSRPVMFWMHGGGFRTGSGSSPWYDGTNIAQKQDVVIVTINHRLNVLGYCDLSAYGEQYADSANVGMLDCILALQWVRDNIENFGGDPSRILIHGESGGGRKTSVMMALEPAQGLFHRAVVQSGSALRMDAQSLSQEKARRLLAALEIAPGDVAKLHDVPLADLMRAQARAAAGLGQWRPAVNNVSLKRHPFDPDAPEQSRNIPMMIGTNRTEQAAFLGTSAEVDTMDELGLRQRLGDWLPTDRIEPALAMYRRLYPESSNAEILYMASTDRGYFLDSTIQAERKAAQGGAPAYHYQFYYKSPVQDGRYFTPHAMEIPFVFDSLANAPYMVGEVTEENQALADKVSALWASFARDGVPKAAGVPEWTPYNAETRPSLVLDVTPRIENDIRKEQREFMLAVGSQQMGQDTAGDAP